MVGSKGVEKVELGELLGEDGEGAEGFKEECEEIIVGDGVFEEEEIGRRFTEAAVVGEEFREGGKGNFEFLLKLPNIFR